MAKTATQEKSFKQQAEDVVADFDGWTLVHAKEPSATHAPAPGGGTVSTVAPGHLIALKRSDTNAIVEFADETPDGLKAKIEDWEASRPRSEPVVPTEEQVMNSAHATAHMAVTAGARPAVDVVLPQQTETKPADVRRLAVKPIVEEQKLKQEDQDAIAAGRPESDFGGGAA